MDGICFSKELFEIFVAAKTEDNVGLWGTDVGLVVSLHEPSNRMLQISAPVSASAFVFWLEFVNELVVFGFEVEISAPRELRAPSSIQEEASLPFAHLRYRSVTPGTSQGRELIERNAQQTMTMVLTSVSTEKMSTLTREEAIQKIDREVLIVAQPATIQISIALVLQC